MTKAEIALEITKLEIKKQNLLIDGRTAEAARLDLEIKRLQVSSSRAGTEAKLAEAKATQELVLRQFLEAEARGTLTPALRQELNTRYEQQRAVILETEASKLNEEQQRKNIDAAQKGGAARTDLSGSVDRNSGSTDVNSDALRKNSDALRSNRQDKADNARATNALTIEQEKYAAALEKARREEGITGNQYGPGSDNTLGRGPASIGTNNSTFTLPSFQSGSRAGTTETVQFQPPDSSGNWVFDSEAFNRAYSSPTSKLSPPDPSRFWAYTGPPTPGAFAGPGTNYGALPPRAPAPTPAPAPAPMSAPAGQVLGRYEIVLKSGAKAFVDSQSQAQAFIDELQASLRAAGG